MNDQPLAIIAKTYKGAGVSFLQDKDGWHGKPLNKEEAAKAIAELQPSAKSGIGVRDSRADTSCPSRTTPLPASYPADQLQAGRLRRHARSLRQRAPRASAKWISASSRWTATRKTPPLPKNSSRNFPERSFECFIAEQNMVGVAIGFGTRGKVPFASTFAWFFTRASDHIRVAGISQANVKLVGSHVGVSIGEDGPSQMGLEDLAMMRAVVGSTVLYPSDAVSAEKLARTNGADTRAFVTCALRARRRRSFTATTNNSPSAARKCCANGRQGHGRRRGRHAVRSVEGRRPIEGRRHQHHRH